MSTLSFLIYGIPDLFVALFILMPVMLSVPYALELFFILIAKVGMQWMKMTFPPQHFVGKLFYCGTDAFTVFVLLSAATTFGSVVSGLVVLYAVRIVVNAIGINL